jgi:hypothetical protein
LAERSRSFAKVMRPLTFSLHFKARALSSCRLIAFSPVQFVFERRESSPIAPGEMSQCALSRPRFAAAPLWCPIQKRAASLAGSTDTWLHGAPLSLFGNIDLKLLLDFLLEGERAPTRKPAPAARRGSPNTSASPEGSGSSGRGLGLAFNVLASGSPQHSATSGCSLQSDGAAVLERFVGLGGGIQGTVMPTERPLPSCLPSPLQNGASLAGPMTLTSTGCLRWQKIVPMQERSGQYTRS